MFNIGETVKTKARTSTGEGLDVYTGVIRKIEMQSDGTAYVHFETSYDNIRVEVAENLELVSAPGTETKAKRTRRSRNIKKLALFTSVKQTVKSHTILGQERIKDYIRIAAKLNEAVLIFGHTGVGKTTVVKDVANELGKEAFRFNLTGETSVEEFVGKYILQSRVVESEVTEPTIDVVKPTVVTETVWQDGVLLQAMKKGQWFICDEVNAALSDITFILHQLLDDDRAITVSAHNGEVVKAHDEFRFFATMNPVEEYSGTKDLNKALKSRFGVVINMQYPAPEIETEIIVQKSNLKDKSIAVMVVDVATQLRQAKSNDDIYYICSTRDLIQWANLIDSLGIADAFEVTIFNKANGDGDKVNEILKSITGKYIKVQKEGKYELNIEKLIKANEQLQQEKDLFESDKSEYVEQVVREIMAKFGKPETKALPPDVAEPEQVEAEAPELSEIPF